MRLSVLLASAIAITVPAQSQSETEDACATVTGLFEEMTAKEQMVLGILDRYQSAMLIVQENERQSVRTADAYCALSSLEKISGEMDELTSSMQTLAGIIELGQHLCLDELSAVHTPKEIAELRANLDELNAGYDDNIKRGRNVQAIAGQTAKDGLQDYSESSQTEYRCDR